MKLNATSLNQAWQARQPRERGLLIAMAFVVPLLLADAWVWNPWRVQSKALEQRATQGTQGILQLQQLQSAQGTSVSPDNAAVKQLAALRQKLVQLEQLTQAAREQVMSPEAMAAQLREVTDAHGAVKVTAMRSMPVAAMTDTGAGGGSNAAPRLYRHAFELQVEGSYVDIARYLDTLEHTAPVLRWSALELDASRHPTVGAKLEVFTLSPQASWIQL
jgi:MSHA biogenesis protein MshJ